MSTADRANSISSQNSVPSMVGGARPSDPVSTDLCALIQLHPVDLRRKPFEISSSVIRIGRDKKSDLVIDDGSVSRHHAEIRLSDQGAIILDTDSTNGVSVNGVKCASQPLERGDDIQIGSHLFRFLCADENLDDSFRASVYSMMTRDGLTQVFNTHFFFETLSREIARCRRHQRPLAIVVMDVDRFSSVNQRFGEPIGDIALQQISRRIDNVIRDYDVLARLRGNTFAVALPEVTADEAVEIAERCRMAVDSEPIVTPVGPIPLTMTLGVVAPETDEISPPPELLDEAMDRLLEGKRVGGNVSIRQS